MNNLIVYLGTIYFVIGTLFLLVPLIYLELGRPKDFIKAFLNLLIGLILIIKNKNIDESFLVIPLLLTTVLVVLYFLEIFLSRWNQLTDKEKNKLVTFLELKNNLSKLLQAINLGLKNFTKSLDFFNFLSNNEKINPKKWVRNDKNDKNDKIKI